MQHLQTLGVAPLRCQVQGCPSGEVQGAHEPRRHEVELRSMVLAALATKSSSRCLGDGYLVAFSTTCPLLLVS